MKTLFEAANARTDDAIRTLLEGQSALIAQVERLAADKAGLMEANNAFLAYHESDMSSVDHLLAYDAAITAALKARAALEQHGGGK